MSIIYKKQIKINENIIFLINGDKKWANKIEEATRIKVVICSEDFVLNYKAKPEYECILIPKSDNSALFLSKNKNKIKKNGYKFLTSNFEIIDNLSDKKKLSLNLLSDYLPKTYNINNIIYPFVLKKRIGDNGMHVYKINNEYEFKKKLLEIDNLDEYIFQEAILSKYEYSTQFLVINGKIILMYTKLIKAKDNLFIRGKHYRNFKTININSHFIDKTVFEKFFKNYNGLINCNYKIKNNNIIIIEFNTRIAGNIFSMDSKDLNILITSYIENCQYD